MRLRASKNDLIHQLGTGSLPVYDRDPVMSGVFITRSLRTLRARWFKLREQAVFL